MMDTQKKINSKRFLAILIKFSRQQGRFNTAKTNEIYIKQTEKTQKPAR